MSDVKDFFETFYAQPDKQKQDAILLKHCMPVTVKRCRRSNNSTYAKQTFQTKFYIYSTSEKKEGTSVSTLFFDNFANNEVQSPKYNEGILPHWETFRRKPRRRSCFLEICI